MNRQERLIPLHYGFTRGLGSWLDALFSEYVEAAHGCGLSRMARLRGQAVFRLRLWAEWRSFADIRLCMTLGWNRILSGSLAICYILGASAAGGAEGGFKILLCVTLPLACIWFGDAMGNYTGPSGSIWVTAPSPGVFVQILGWLVLLLPVIFMLVGLFGG